MPVDTFDAARAGVRFARTLRRAGVAADTTRLGTFMAALDSVGVEDQSGVYWVGRASFCSSPADFPAYDAAFAACFGGGTAGNTGLVPDPPAPRRHRATATAKPAAVDAATVDEPEAVPVAWSTTEVLRTKDFASFTDAEFDELAVLMAKLRFGATRPSRRGTPARRGRPHLRATLRASLRSGGEIERWRYLGPATRPRRLVLLCDVSGSMEPYARGFLRFMHAAVAGNGSAEAFCIGTRLTRISDELASRDPDAALAAASEAVADWSGGTRLGEGLRRFLDDWGQRGAARGATVVILSDGWDHGNPDLLAGQMARLGRLAHRVVWVNPLKARDDYAPLAGGMAAALPYVDDFLEGHNWVSLERLADVVREL